MKYKKSSLLISVLLIMCVLLNSISVMAADERLGEIVDGSLLTENLESTGTTQSLARGTFLSYGTGGITNDGNHQVSISGTTVCYNTCDKVKVALYLQRLSGNSWVNVATLGPKTAYNAYKVSNSKSYTVTGGYYYRVYGSHVAIDNGSTESVVSFTDGIWISK